VNIQDLPGAPKYVPIMLTQMNLGNDDLTNLVNGNLTIGDNVNGMIFKTSFVTPTAYLTGEFNTFRFNFTGSTPPNSVTIGQIACTSPIEAIISPVSVFWNLVNNVSPNQVFVSYIAGLKANHTYSVTLLVQ
jgi:hypothetical protein